VTRWGLCWGLVCLWLGGVTDTVVATKYHAGRGEEELDTIFSHGALNEYHLQVGKSQWEWLNTHELLEEYVEGNLSFKNFNTPGGVGSEELFEKVGIRYKGSKGSLEYCFSNATSGNEGSSQWNKRLCKKLSIKLSFDKYDDRGRFYDQKKLNLHAMQNDPSLMRECLAYHLYRSMGLKVSRCAHAKVFVNGRYEGVYLAVENVDSRFLEHHFGEKEGVLFKEKWPGIGEDANHADYFLEGVKNRKSSTTKSDIEPMLKFSQKLWDAKDSDEVAHALHKYWNLESITRVLAVASVIDDWDSFFTFFPSDPNRHQDPSNGQRRFNHNFYVYQDGGGKLNLIHWDTDLTFSEYGSVLELFFGLPAWNVPLCEPHNRRSTTCTPCKEYLPYNVSQGSPTNGGILPGAGCDKILNFIATDPATREGYLKDSWYFLQRVFIPSELEKVVRAWQARGLEEAHRCDPNYPAGKGIFPDPSQNGTAVNWKEEVQSLLGTIRQEYKLALERTNPVYQPHVPDRKKIGKVFKCVTDCSKFMSRHDIKSLYTCYSICLHEVSPFASSQV